MPEIRQGQQVTLLCSSFLEDGQSLDSEPNEPLVLTAGKKSKSYFSNKISESLIGMKVDEIKHFKVPGEHLFGKRNPLKILKLDFESENDYFVGKEINLKVINNNEEKIVDGEIVKIEGNTAFVDTNHPLCTQTIVVKLQIISFK